MLIDLDEETLNKGEGDGPHAQSDFVEKAEQDPDKSKRTAFVSNLDYSIDEDGIGQIFAKVSSQVIDYNKLPKHSICFFLNVFSVGLVCKCTIIPDISVVVWGND